MKVFVVDIKVNLPAEDKVEEMQLTYLFNEQPTVDSVIKAFDSDLFLQTTPEFDTIRTHVLYGLETWGVPKLQDHPTQEAGVHRMFAHWVANVYDVHNKKSQYNQSYGSVAVFRKSIL